jgi:hypothetical protein
MNGAATERATPQHNMKEREMSTRTVHCESEKAAEAFLKPLHDEGWKWESGDSLLDSKFSMYEKRTHYHVHSHTKRVTYGNNPYFGVTPVEFVVPPRSTKPILTADWDGVHYNADSINSVSLELINSNIKDSLAGIKRQRQLLKRHASLAKKLGWKEAK